MEHILNEKPRNLERGSNRISCKDIRKTMAIPHPSSSSCFVQIFFEKLIWGNFVHVNHSDLFPDWEGKLFIEPSNSDPLLNDGKKGKRPEQKLFIWFPSSKSISVGIRSAFPDRNLRELRDSNLKLQRATTFFSLENWAEQKFLSFLWIFFGRRERGGGKLGRRPKILSAGLWVPQWERIAFREREYQLPVLNGTLKSLKWNCSHPFDRDQGFWDAWCFWAYVLFLPGENFLFPWVLFHKVSQENVLGMKPGRQEVFSAQNVTTKPRSLSLERKLFFYIFKILSRSGNFRQVRSK